MSALAFYFYRIIVACLGWLFTINWPSGQSIRSLITANLLIREYINALYYFSLLLWSWKSTPRSSAGTSKPRRNVARPLLLKNWLKLRRKYLCFPLLRFLMKCFFFHFCSIKAKQRSTDKMIMSPSKLRVSFTFQKTKKLIIKVAWVQ